MNIWDILFIIIKFGGALAVFLFAMKMMSEGLQKIAGSRMRSVLSRFTGRPINGILTGLVVTAIIQSSSATTVMVVSFVNAGMLTLRGAIAVIMGANIGTTATAWIITFFGLGGGDGAFSLPMLLGLVSLLFIFSKKDKLQSIGQTIMGLTMLLVGMELLQAAMPNLEEHPGLLQAMASIGGFGFWSVLLFIAIGTLLTCLVQSSSAMMAITLLMCYNGMITRDIAIALVLGQNIGTTITANLAAMVTNAAGKKAARAHLVFNLVGVILTLILLRPMTALVTDIFPTDLPMAITLFHTLFNVGNTLVLMWFIPQIEKLVDWMVHEKKEESEEPFRLTYIEPTLLSTAELNLQSAKKEIEEFSKRVLRMYTFLPSLRTAKNDQEFDDAMQRIAKYEGITDRMEMEISKFLTRVGSGDVSEHASQRISSMLRIIDNLESIGDTVYQIAMTRKNKREEALHFDQGLNDNLKQMTMLVQAALDIMDRNLHDYDNVDLDSAYAAEHAINDFRNKLRTEHLDAIKLGRYDYATGNAYSSLYALYEKLGDFVINVSEAIDSSRKHQDE